MWANKSYDNFIKLPIHNRQALFGRGGEKNRHLATTNKRKNGLQAGGRGGGGKFRKFQGPINVLTCDGVQEKG